MNINVSDINHVFSMEEIKKAGIDTAMYKTCRMLRDFAKDDDFIVDENPHNVNTNNLHLFPYIKDEYGDLHAFIREYLKNVQPFMLLRLRDQEKREGLLCALDFSYKISLYIKIKNENQNNQTKNKQKIVISFHEENDPRTNFGKLVNRQGYYHIFSNDEYVPVFARSFQITKKQGQPDKLDVDIDIQRGNTLFHFYGVPGYRCEKNLFIVPAVIIERRIVQQCNDKVEDIYKNYANGIADYQKTNPFTALQDVSVTSYGLKIPSIVSILLDYREKQKENRYSNKLMGEVGDVLLTYLSHIPLLKSESERICTILDTRYKVSSTRQSALFLHTVADFIQHHFIDADTTDQTKENVTLISQNNNPPKNQLHEVDIYIQQIDSDLNPEISEDMPSGNAGDDAREGT